MTEELKTLKDFRDMKIITPKGQIEDYMFSEKELKAEAIKWVKESISLCPSCCFPEHICDIEQFWMERFNLTEEDLRND